MFKSSNRKSLESAFSTQVSTSPAQRLKSKVKGKASEVADAGLSKVEKKPSKRTQDKLKPKTVTDPKKGHKDSKKPR